MKNRTQIIGLVALCLLLAGADQAELPDAKSQLQQLQAFIGEWRGVGQLRRGSSKGAWQEKSEWKWSFGKEKVALVFEAKDGKHFQAGSLQTRDNANEYKLTLTTNTQQSLEFHGRLDDEGMLTVDLDMPPKNYEGPTSVSFRQVANGDRLVVQLHKTAPTGRKISMGMIGYTKIGSNFGKGISYVECIVTGGKATIPVIYMGKTYYVCCGGCKDYFDDDPKRAVDEYYERKAEEKASAK